MWSSHKSMAIVFNIMYMQIVQVILIVQVMVTKKNYTGW